MRSPARVLVLGGHGHLGARICRALARHGAAELVVAGRNGPRIGAFVHQLSEVHSGVGIESAVLDVTATGFADALRRLGVDIVVHTAGPFQARDYSVAEACIGAGCHYVDLADGRRYVCDFKTLDQQARSRDVLLVTGASTLPGLSSAVITLLKNGMRQIETIEISIVPGGQTPPGQATVAGVLACCGKPVAVFEDGRWSERIGWQDARKIRYPWFTRRVAVCDVPDLELFPDLFKGVNSVTFRAGPELPWEHFALRLMASLARRGVVSDWSRYSRVLRRMSRFTAPLASDQGGMHVFVRGSDFDGSTIERRWDLIARSNHGPEIPCIPAIALAKKLIENRIAARGAMPCLGLMGFEEFAIEAQGFDIDWNLTRVS